MDDAMSRDGYRGTFSCDKPGCGTRIVPVKLSVDKKQDAAKVLATCPSCKKSYEFSLPLDESRSWQAVLGRATFTCLGCGKEALKLLGIEGNPRERRVMVTCVSCEKKDDRSIAGSLMPLVEPHLPPADRLSLQCGTCGSWLREQPNCPVCGRDAFCKQCGSYIHGSAITCPRCKAAVYQGDPRKRVP